MTISGHMEYDGSGEPILHIIDDTVFKWHTITGSDGCGGGQLFPITLPSIDLEFTLEDGHKIEWDFDMLVVTGESSVTLHVP